MELVVRRIIKQASALTHAILFKYLIWGSIRDSRFETWGQNRVIASDIMSFGNVGLK